MIAFTEWLVKILGVMMDIMSKNARMIYVDFMDFIGTLYGIHSADLRISLQTRHKSHLKHVIW